jgi:hypothetical protein
MLKEVKDSENLRTRTSELLNQIKDVSLHFHSRNLLRVQHSSDCHGIDCYSISNALGDVKIKANNAQSVEGTV